MRVELVEQELVTSVVWFINIRWLAGIGVLLAAWFVDVVLRFSIPAIPLYLIGILIVIYNAVFRFVLNRLVAVDPHNIGKYDTLTKAQISLDWLAMTGLIHFTGGLESPIILFFFFHIIIAAILLSPRATYVAAGMAVVLIGVTTAFEYLGIFPHVHIPEFVSAELYRSPVYILGTLVFFYSTLFVAAYLASTLSKRLRQRESEVIRLSETLQRAYSRLQTLYESAQTINSTLELQQVLDRIVQRTAHAMNVRACSIRLLDQTGARLTVASVYGLSDAYVQKGDLELEHNPLAREVLAGKIISIGDVTSDTRLQYPAQAITEGIRSMLSVPLSGRKGPLGLIRAYSIEPNHFTNDDATFLSAIAEQGTVAIENAMAYHALGQVDEMKSKFVLTVTHELRSPVSVVRSLLRTMLAGYTGDLTENQRDTVTRVLHRADFLQTLIDDLLDLAAGKSDMKSKDERVLVRLNEVMQKIVERYETPAQEKQITLEYKSQVDRPLVISATNEGMDRIINNLVSNAIKYTPTGGRVQIVLKSENNFAQLDVTDSGIGIPEESLKHLFEEFYRAPNAKAQVKEGTGLGLAITKDLVTRYGGHITVQSKEGRGTTFSVVFPLVVE
jgi:signal transduction histidine kinase